MNNWSPANSTIGPYNRKNYSSAINISGGIRNASFQNAVNASRQYGTAIASGTFGSVIRLSDPRFVMKTMKFGMDDVSDNVKIFLNEVRVGSTPGIQAVGPKIYAFRIKRNSFDRMIEGQYIMDNLGTFEDLLTYTRHTCPPKGHPMYQKLRETIEKFWRITKGYHGDLHTKNIAVITSPNGNVRFKIIDYGSHKKFKNKVNNKTCFDDFIKMIDKQFNNKYQKITNPNNKGYHPQPTSVRVIYAKRGQPLRSNAEMFRGLKISGYPITKYKFSNSFMNHVNPMNNNAKIKNALTRRKPNSTLAKLFLSPRLFNRLKNSSYNFPKAY